MEAAGPRADTAVRGVSANEAGLVAISRDALILTDFAGKIRFANPAAGELLNTDPEVLPTRLLVAFVETADRRGFRASRDLAAAGETVEFTCQLAPRRLRPFAVQVHVAPLGTGLGWVLREEREHVVAPPADLPVAPESVQLGHVFEAVRDGVVVVDRDRCVLFGNSAARAMFAPHELELGKAVPDPWTLSVRLLVDELFAHDAFNAEAIVEPAPGTAYWVRAYQSARDTAVLLLSDVTADERREQAERDFVAHAAHELQSPLAGIAGAVEVLLEGAHDVPEERVRFLGHITREVDRLTRLVGSLLLLAQAEATDVAVETEPVALRPLLERVSAEPEVADAVDLVCPPQLHVEAHPHLLEHALVNLVRNAVRHGGVGRIRVEASRTPDGEAVIEVTDFGQGIPPEERVRVFERFYRGGARSGDGFGLGLAIAQQAARAVGGDLTLRPNPEGGTVAALTLRSAT